MTLDGVKAGAMRLPSSFVLTLALRRTLLRRRIIGTRCAEFKIPRAAAVGTCRSALLGFRLGSGCFPGHRGVRVARALPLACGRAAARHRLGPYRHWRQKVVVSTRLPARPYSPRRTRSAGPL